METAVGPPRTLDLGSPALLTCRPPRSSVLERLREGLRDREAGANVAQTEDTIQMRILHMLADNWPLIAVLVIPMLLTWFGKWGNGNARW